MTNAVVRQGLIATLFATSLSAASQAVPDVGMVFHDVVVGVGVTPTPEVTERSSNAAGVTTGYDWQGTRDSGTQITIASLNGRAYRWGGIVCGAELAVGLYNLTPETFSVAGATFNNSSDATLNGRSIGGNLLLGYQIGIMKQDGLRAYAMILPHIGGGIMTAENEVHVGSTYSEGRGTGLYGEYGIRAVGMITERNWLYGVSVGYVRGSSKVDIDIDQYSTELRMKRSGASIMFHGGYRF